MKILVVGQSNNPGGVETVIKRYYETVKDDVQFDLMVFTDICYDEEYYKEHNSNIIFIKSAQFRQPFKYKKEIKTFFEQNRGIYSAIWFNCCDLANCGYIMKQAKKAGIKKRIIHAHNNQLMHTGKKRKFYELVHNYWKNNIDRYATDYWACSELAGEFFYKKSILESDNYRIINNAIEVKKYCRNTKIRDKVRTELGIGNNDIVVGHVGRFQYQKNHELLIDIYNSFHKKYSDSRLLLVGQGVEEAAIKDKVNKLKLEENVMFLGIRSDVNEIMQAMDVFVFPSLYEGLPVTMVEAQAAGLPCIISDKVPEECIITTNLVTTQKLTDSPKIWAEHIIGRAKNTRTDHYDEMKSHGYDIEEAAKWLQNYYIAHSGE